METFRQLVNATRNEMIATAILPIFASVLTMLPSLRHRVIAAGTCTQWRAETRAFLHQLQQITFNPISIFQSGVALNVEALAACVGPHTTQLDVHCFCTTEPLLRFIAANTPMLVTLRVSAECSQEAAVQHAHTVQNACIAAGLTSLIRECCNLDESSVLKLAQMLLRVCSEDATGWDCSEDATGWAIRWDAGALKNGLSTTSGAYKWTLEDQLPPCYDAATPLPSPLGIQWHGVAHQTGGMSAHGEASTWDEFTDVVMQLAEPLGNAANSTARLSHRELSKLVDGQAEYKESMPFWFKTYLEAVGTCTEDCWIQWHQKAGVLKMVTERVEVTKCSSTRWTLSNSIGILQRDGRMQLIRQGFGTWSEETSRFCAVVDDELLLVRLK